MALEMFDSDYRDFDNREAADKSVFARFYFMPEEVPKESKEAGRPIYRDREYVEIIAAGNSTNRVIRPVSDLDRNRFRAQYAKFKEGDMEQLMGTPLTEVPWLTRSQVEEFAYLKIRTLEQLAGVGDDVCTRVPGLFSMKKKAGLALEKSEKAAPILALQKENEDLRGQIESLREAIKDQSTQLAKLK